MPEFLEKGALKKILQKIIIYSQLVLKNKKIFNTIVKAHGYFPKHIKMLKPTEAEILKYFINLYASLRITFANIFYEISNKFNSNYDAVKNAT